MNASTSVWLTALQDLRRTMNQPTLRELEGWSGISYSHLSRYFSGRTLPKDEHLTVLLRTLEANADEEKTIVEDVRAARVEQRSQVGRRKEPLPQQTPTGDLAALTEAIIELNGLLREFLQEQRRYPE